MGLLVGLAAMSLTLAPPTSAANAAKGLSSRALAHSLKKLQRQDAALAKRIATLEAKAGNLGPAGPPGPAGGALAGSYPNPVLAPDSVTSVNFLDNSISGDRIAQAALNTDDVADGAINSAKVAPGTIGPRQLGIGSVGTTAIANHSILPADLAGASVHGIVGAAQLHGLTPEFGDPVIVQPGKANTSEATCPTGTVLLGGGLSWEDSSHPKASAIISAPLVGQNGNLKNTWLATVHNGDTAAVLLKAVAVCLS